MRRAILGLAGLLGLAGPAAAQNPTQPFPTINPNAVMPNIFNPATQPLSPYLNLLRGGNRAANYYYGVRPGTVAAGFGAFGGSPFTAGGGNRPLFFPQLASAPDPFGTFNPGAGDVLPPAGHGAVFNNTMGFFPGAGGQAGGARSGLGGLGATRAPGRK